MKQNMLLFLKQIDNYIAFKLIFFLMNRIPLMR